MHTHLDKSLICDIEQVNKGGALLSQRMYVLSQVKLIEEELEVSILDDPTEGGGEERKRERREGGGEGEGRGGRGEERERGEEGEEGEKVPSYSSIAIAPCLFPSACNSQFGLLQLCNSQDTTQS